jgi:hypothetical protein
VLEEIEVRVGCPLLELLERRDERNAVVEFDPPYQRVDGGQVTAPERAQV